MSGTERKTRPHEFKMRLSDEEHEAIIAKSARVGLSKTAFMRQASLGRKMPPVVDTDVLILLREIAEQQKELFGQYFGVMESNHKEQLDEIMQALLYQINRLS